MSQVTNASKIAFSTAFNVDKIVGIYTGSYNSATQTTTLGGYLYQYAIPHSFTRPVFCDLLVSTDGVNYQDGGTTGGTLAGIAYSDASNIYVTTGNASGTIFYKVVASWIDNYDTTNPLVTPVFQGLTNSAFFDSRQNYQKTYTAGVVTATALGTDTLFNIAHSLGYTPNAKLYFEAVSGQVWPQIYGGTNDYWLYATSMSECYEVISSSNLTIDCFPSATGHSTRVWYKIYLDQ
jgi:hypothetical protein